LSEEIPGAIVNGSLKHRLPNNIHLTIPGADNERLLFALDGMGIMAAAGSACSASSQTPSSVLQAIGLNDDDARSSLRFTMGRMTTLKEVDLTINSLKDILAKK
jgi:cysteine desulfurase